MPNAREYPEGRVWEKTAERLAQRRLMLDLITVADDDDGRNGDGLQAGADIFDHAPLSPFPLGLRRTS